MNKSIVTSIIAGKLACGMPSVYAADISLNELGSVADMLTLPTSQKAGQLHVESAAKQSIDFIVKGVPQNSAVQVFLAYSKSAGFAEDWDAFGGELGSGFELENEAMKLLAGVTVEPFSVAARLSEQTDLGEYNQSEAGVVLPVSISDLTEIGEEGDTIFFQVMIIPLNDSGVLQVDLAQSSEVDKFIIDRGILVGDGGGLAPVDGKNP